MSLFLIDTGNIYIQPYETNPIAQNARLKPNLIRSASGVVISGRYWLDYFNRDIPNGGFIILIISFIF